MKKNNPSQPLYYVFGIAIVVLVGLIGYFSYLLLVPNKLPEASNSNAAVVTNGNKNKNANSNNNANANANKNSNANTAGLVEPDEDTNENENANTNTSATNKNTSSNTNKVVAGEGEKVITLYFTKSDADCGEVFPVQRAVEPEDDFYGQIILANMHGPSDEEADYTSAIPGGLRLRWVDYTADGARVYVNEAYNELDACDQKTVKAQLVETANAMFDLKEGADGELLVGSPDDEEDTNNNSNTNTSDEE